MGVRPDDQDPLAELEAEFAGHEVRSDIDVVLTFMAVYTAAQMLGATEVIESMERDYEDMRESISQVPPEDYMESVRRMAEDPLLRGREVDKIERHGDEMAKRLAAWLTDRGLGVIQLLVPILNPAVGIMVHGLVLNHERGPAFLVPVM